MSPARDRSGRMDHDDVQGKVMDSPPVCGIHRLSMYRSENIFIFASDFNFTANHVFIALSPYFKIVFWIRVVELIRYLYPEYDHDTACATLCLLWQLPNCPVLRYVMHRRISMCVESMRFNSISTCIPCEPGDTYSYWFELVSFPRRRIFSSNERTYSLVSIRFFQRRWSSKVRYTLYPLYGWCTISRL